VNDDLTMVVLGTMGCTVGAGYGVNSGKTLVLEAHDALRLVCGPSTIELTEKGITLVAPAITLRGEDVSTQAEDASLHVSKGKIALAAKDEAKVSADAVLAHGKDATTELTSDGVQIAAKKNVSLKSKGASLVLDDNAAIDGQQVNLNCGGSASGNFGDGTPDKLKTSWVEIELLDQDGKPVPETRYVVTAGGHDYAGVLDTKGRARVPIQPGSATVAFPDFDGEAWKPA
jgi:uncharacterized protein (DUF2345 family)